LIKALRQVFAFAVDNDLAQRNPVKDAVPQERVGGFPYVEHRGSAAV
jgi:hypothetical protein